MCGQHASTGTCTAPICHRAWELGAEDVGGLDADLEAARGFRMDLGHLSVVGVCRDCREEAEG